MSVTLRKMEAICMLLILNLFLPTGDLRTFIYAALMSTSLGWNHRSFLRNIPLSPRDNSLSFSDSLCFNIRTLVGLNYWHILFCRASQLFFSKAIHLPCFILFSLLQTSMKPQMIYPFSDYYSSYPFSLCKMQSIKKDVGFVYCPVQMLCCAYV